MRVNTRYIHSTKGTPFSLTVVSMDTVFVTAIPTTVERFSCKSTQVTLHLRVPLHFILTVLVVVDHFWGASVGKLLERVNIGIDNLLPTSSLINRKRFLWTLSTVKQTDIAVEPLHVVGARHAKRKAFEHSKIRGSGSVQVLCQLSVDRGQNYKLGHLAWPAMHTNGSRFWHKRLWWS